MITQELMIQKVREICEQDNTLLAAMMYGSFGRQGGDQYSDIEFVLFFEDDAADTLDQHAWLSQIAPLEICYVNEFGVTDAIFDNLIRGEFHSVSISVRPQKNYRLTYHAKFVDNFSSKLTCVANL